MASDISNGNGEESGSLLRVLWVYACKQDDGPGEGDGRAMGTIPEHSCDDTKQAFGHTSEGELT